MLHRPCLPISIWEGGVYIPVYANQRLRVASVGQYVRLLLVNWTRGPHRRQKRKTVARDGTVRLHVRFGTVAFGQSVCQRTLASVGQSVRFCSLSFVFSLLLARALLRIAQALLDQKKYEDTCGSSSPLTITSSGVDSGASKKVQAFLEALTAPLGQIERSDCVY